MTLFHYTSVLSAVVFIWVAMDTIWRAHRAIPSPAWVVGRDNYRPIIDIRNVCIAGFVALGFTLALMIYLGIYPQPYQEKVYAWAIALFGIVVPLLGKVFTSIFTSEYQRRHPNGYCDSHCSCRD